MKPAELSVVIATFNRCETLRETLLKLREQSLDMDAFEVIVVDDGSTDGTTAMVKALQPDSPYGLRCLRHENRGPGYTQNRGLRAARNEVVLLLADDIHPTAHLLEEHRNAHLRQPEPHVAVLGKVLQSPELPQTIFQRHWNPFRYDLLNGKREVESICFFACNISVKRRFLLSNGLFLEQKGAAHEDIELGYRLGRKGLRILYQESALAYHYHAETLERACQRAFERGWNFDLLSDHIPKSYIFRQYSILSLEAGPAAFLVMLPRELLRGVFFNQWSVDYFWLPLLKRADKNRVASCLANSYTYRGVVNYHLRKGYRQKHLRRMAHRHA